MPATATETVESLRDRVQRAESSLEKNQSVIEISTRQIAEANERLADLLASGADPDDREVSQLRRHIRAADSAKTEALENIGLLRPKIETCRRAYEDALRCDEVTALRKALPIDEDIAQEIATDFEKKIRELGEILARGVAHFAAHSDRASRLEKLSPQDRHGWAVQCAWNRSDGRDQLHEALGRIRKQLEDVAYQEDRKVWITSVDIPVLMEK